MKSHNCNYISYCQTLMFDLQTPFCLSNYQTRNKIYTVCSVYSGSLNPSVQIWHYFDPTLRTGVHILSQLPGFPEVKQTCLIISLNLVQTFSEAPTTLSNFNSKYLGGRAGNLAWYTAGGYKHKGSFCAQQQVPSTNTVNPEGAQSAPSQMGKSLYQLTRSYLSTYCL